MGTVSEKDTEKIVSKVVAPILHGSWYEEDEG